jgi:hypothetical protein
MQGNVVYPLTDLNLDLQLLNYKVYYIMLFKMKSVHNPYIII